MIGSRSTSARNQFERQTARTDDDGSSKFDHFSLAFAKYIARLLPASQVLRQVFVTTAESTQVDDAANSVLSRGFREIRRGLPVHLFEIAVCPHRVNEIISRVDPVHGISQRRLVERVALHDLR